MRLISCYDLTKPTCNFLLTRQDIQVEVYLPVLWWMTEPSVVTSQHRLGTGDMWLG